MVEGEFGILAISSDWCRPIYEPSKRKLTWPNGAIAHTFSSEEADRFRGPQFDFAWADELAAWNEPQATWDMLQFGLRLGAHPRWIVTTTPRPIKLLKDLLAREGRDVIVRRGSTFDNAANLAGPFLEAIRAKYEGTRLGRQELNAELLEDTPGALWQRSWIDRDQCSQPLRSFGELLSPSILPSKPRRQRRNRHCRRGIDGRGHAYVLDDISGKFGPDEWARRAVNAYRRWSADRIIAEKNQGGAMVEHVIRSVDKNVPFRAVHASRGKATRPQPISSLYEQGKCHHVGEYAVLEDQLCGFTSDFDRGRAGFSPDRLDALVWALTELMVKLAAPPPIFGTYGLGGGNVLPRRTNTNAIPAVYVGWNGSLVK